MHIFRYFFFSVIERICDFFGIDFDNPYPRNPFMLYYGCPNSDKAAKLQTKKKIYK